MVNAEDLRPALRGKSRSDQLRVIHAIIDASKRGGFPLEAADGGVLTRFVTQLQQGRTVDDALLLAVSGIVRHYGQHLIAIARNVR